MRARVVPHWEESDTRQGGDRYSECVTMRSAKMPFMQKSSSHDESDQHAVDSDGDLGYHPVTGPGKTVMANDLMQVGISFDTNGLQDCLVDTISNDPLPPRLHSPKAIRIQSPHAVLKDLQDKVPKIALPSTLQTVSSFQAPAFAREVARDMWQPDSERDECSLPSCSTKFGTWQRRHHCRQCGCVICASCSANKKLLLPPFGHDGPARMARVCNACNVNPDGNDVGLPFAGLELDVDSRHRTEGDSEIILSNRVVNTTNDEIKVISVMISRLQNEAADRGRLDTHQIAQIAALQTQLGSLLHMMEDAAANYSYKVIQ